MRGYNGKLPAGVIDRTDKIIALIDKWDPSVKCLAEIEQLKTDGNETSDQCPSWLPGGDNIILCQARDIGRFVGIARVAGIGFATLIKGGF